jgi:hypothetical protein
MCVCVCVPRYVATSDSVNVEETNRIVFGLRVGGGILKKKE